MGGLGWDRQQTDNAQADVTTDRRPTLAVRANDNPKLLGAQEMGKRLTCLILINTIWKRECPV